MRTATSSTEESRIKAAYEKRDRSIPENFYSFLRPANLLPSQELERRLALLLAEDQGRQLSCMRILEVGCGCGTWLQQFLRLGARPQNLAGVDLLEERIVAARELLPCGTTLLCGNAENVDFPSGSFEIVLQSMLFSSILDRDTRKHIAAEMLRLLAPNGYILWYDFFLDNPFNPDVKGMKKRDITECFPNCRLALIKTTLAPPIGRRIPGSSPLMYCLLASIPFLRSHYFGRIVPTSC